MKTHTLLLIIVMTGMLAACSTTKNIPEGDQLYTGLETTRYKTPEKSVHYAAIQEELDAALATAPNGALFGSSSVRSPFQVGLWVWNAFANDSTGFGRWMLKSFGSKPVLMSWVNPELRLCGEGGVAGPWLFSWQRDLPGQDHAQPEEG